MQQRDMRYARIDGTEVIVEVSSATEAKTAIRELKHKKKELKLLRRRMVREQSTGRRIISRIEREEQQAARKRGLVATLRRVSRAFKRDPRTDVDLEAIQRDIECTDEILNNIDSCIIQIEGKLLV